MNGWMDVYCHSTACTSANSNGIPPNDPQPEVAHSLSVKVSVPRKGTLICDIFLLTTNTWLSLHGTLFSCVDCSIKLPGRSFFFGFRAKKHSRWSDRRSADLFFRLEWEKQDYATCMCSYWSIGCCYSLANRRVRARACVCVYRQTVSLKEMFFRQNKSPC